MEKIVSAVDTSSPEFRERAGAYRLLVEDLRARLAEAAKGGTPEAVAQHRERGKMTARERVQGLVFRSSCGISAGAWDPPAAAAESIAPD